MPIYANYPNAVKIGVVVVFLLLLFVCGLLLFVLGFFVVVFFWWGGGVCFGFLLVFILRKHFKRTGWHTGK